METSNVISTYVYNVGIGMQQFSYSTAIDLFNSVVNIILVLTANAVSKKLANTGLW